LYGFGDVLNDGFIESMLVYNFDVYEVLEYIAKRGVHHLPLFG
jgi:hypothetical protein